MINICVCNDDDGAVDSMGTFLTEVCADKIETRLCLEPNDRLSATKDLISRL